MLKTAEDICPDYPEWPKRWEGVPEDVSYGETLIKGMRPFIEHLIAKELAKKTIRRHMDNLWLLGGEIIREVSMDEEYNVPAAEKLRESVDFEGGLYCRHLYTYAEQRSYDATCKKLHKFLEGLG